jgi:hypothetical protein
MQLYSNLSTYYYIQLNFAFYITTGQLKMMILTF